MWINGVIYGKIMSLYNDVKLWDQIFAVEMCSSIQNYIKSVIKFGWQGTDRNYGNVMLYYIFFISLETTVLRNRAGSNVQLFNKPKERKQKSNKKGFETKEKSLWDVRWCLFRCDSICRIAHVCLSVGLSFWWWNLYK